MDNKKAKSCFKLLGYLLIVVVFYSNFACFGQSNKKGKRVVIVPVSNMRVAPEAIASGVVPPALSKDIGGQVTQLLFGEPLYVYEGEEKVPSPWIKVQSTEQSYWRDGGWKWCEGYINYKDAGSIDKLPAYNLVVSSLTAYAFDDGDMALPKLPLPLGVQLHSELVSPTSYKIRLPLLEGAEIIGYVSAQDVTVIQEINQLKASENAQNIMREKLLVLARQCLGVPYVWGGRSIFLGAHSSNLFIGVDCSGFINVLFRVIGITVPRNSQSQFLKTKPLKGGNDMLLGDLFFLSSPTEPYKVEHVGIYVGNDSIIHATGLGYTSAQQAPDKGMLGVQEEACVVLFGKSVVALKSGDVLIQGKFAGKMIHFGSFFLE